MDTEMPTLWRDPDGGICYANFRIPTDLVSHYNKTHILKSLRTKQKREAEDKNEELRRHYKKEWASLWRRRSLNAPLSEEFIPHLIEEWLHDSLRADENGLIAGAIPRTKDGMSEVYYGLVDELAEGSLTGKHPDFLIRAAASFLHGKGITYDSRSLAFAKFVEELSPRYARYLNTLACRDEGQTVGTPAPPKQQLIPLSQLVREFVESRPKRPQINPELLTIWKPDLIRVFLSHRDQYKVQAKELDDCLEPFGFSCFVAHDTRR